MTRRHSDSLRPVHLVGRAIPGAEDRQRLVPGFDQERYSRSHVIGVGAGGLMSHIAPAVLRKGIGALTLLDDDEVEVSNLNRQRFYAKDIGKNKAVALSRNLLTDCTVATCLTAYPLSLQEYVAREPHQPADVVIAAVDNDEARLLASQWCRESATPVIFSGVSREANHGYVFVQEATGPCFRCAFPDASASSSPCPGTPAMIDILQMIGGLVTFCIDTIVSQRRREWNFRCVWLEDGRHDGSFSLSARKDCPVATGPSLHC